MKKLSTIFLVCLLCLASAVKAAPAKSAPDSSDIATIKKNLFFINLHEKAEGSDQVGEYLRNFDFGKGVFKDLDYELNTAAIWQAGMHWRHMVAMARAYQLSGSKFYKDPKIKECIQKGAEYWLASNHMAKNAWWNLIGVPYDMGKIYILMEKELPADLIKRSMKKMLFGVRDIYYYHAPATGQNLLWLTFIHIYASALQGDYAGFARAYKHSADEIIITMYEGIQPDYSFHQHREQSYAFGYGKGFSLTAAQIIYSAQGTYYAIPQEKIDILSAFILDGQQWCTRGRMMEYTARGREICRPGGGPGSIIAATDLMGEINTARSAEFADFNTQLKGGKRKVILSGNRSFPYIDFMSHLRPGFFFSIKGASDRIYSSEMGNGENLKGYYLGKGTQFIALRGDEYEGIFPAWDWERIPGALCTQSHGQLPIFKWTKGARGTTSFVRGESDGTDGCFAYDYNCDSVKARRGWFCVGDVVLGLVSGMEFDTKHDVYQTINQCLARGEVYVDGAKMEQGKDYKNAKSVWHDSIGYLLLSGGDVVLNRGTQTGSWFEIYDSKSKDPVNKDVFALSINEGKKRSNASLSFAILPGVSPSEATKDMISHIKVLRNDNEAQVVWDKRTGKLFIIVYAPTTVTLPYSGRKAFFAVPSVVIYDKKVMEIKS